MTLLLKQLFGFFKLLNSETGTNQIAAGITCGFILGMTPAFSLQTIIVIFVILFFRVQLGAALISAFFFKFGAYLLDPLFHNTGLFFLQLDSLNSLYTALYNFPIIPFTRFNNTIVMGSLVITALMSPIMFLLSKRFVVKYREKVVEKFKETKFFKVLKATSFYKWYYKYDNLYR